MCSYSHVEAKEIDLIETDNRIVTTKPVMATHDCNSRTWETQENLGYIASDLISGSGEVDVPDKG